MEKFDVGIFGVWSGCNYGSIATYYALNQVIKSMGKSVLMIDKPILTANDAERTNTHSRRFANEHYNISQQYRLNEMNKLNEICDAFVIGSDQVWNYGISKNFGKAFYLDFADDDKKKIAYAVSFGHGVDFAPPEERSKIEKLMIRFDGISVREADGVRLCRDAYGIKAQQVLDPVFLDTSIYSKLIEKSSASENEPFLAAYILDPTPEKREAILHLSKELGGIKIINLLDGMPWLFEKNKKQMDLPNCIENLQVEDWLYYLSHAKFILTDSCHGASFAIIFKKDFIAITNKYRGVSRFKSLTDMFHLSSRLITDPKNILTNKNLLNPIDYLPVEKIMSAERTRCLTFLKECLDTPKLSLQELENMNKISISTNPLKNIKIHIDVKHCQMVAALLRDYGIKHVVISSGTRHIELVRFFENNDCFVTHNVVDERSAGFYALGLSVKLRQPVVVCCTSGTASSNYLTSMSEAFYQHVPLIYITADRYPHLLNQREDQMVPQDKMYGNVSLKSVSLIPKDDANTTHADRRMICETILEATRSLPGPVHINIPIAYFSRTPNRKEFYNLDKVHFTKIRRYHLFPNRDNWKSVIDKLSSSSRIMIIYGQNNTLTEIDQKALEEFSEKFNCVFCVDHLSNLKGKKVVNVYNMLKANRLTQEIKKELEADLIITMYGSSVSGIYGIAKTSPNAYHWEVSPNGEAADPFKKLSRIFECTPMQFIKRMNVMAGNRKASDSYYKIWKKYEQIDDEMLETYSQKYAIQEVLKNMPDNSLLHLANSNTIRMSCSYKLKNGVIVYCNRGTNGIDGSASAFMGQAAISDEPCYLLIGDLSFFYDMNSLWNKKLKGNIRIMLFNNSGAGLLEHLKSPAITYFHKNVAEGWVKSLGFTYLSSKSKDEFDVNLQKFVSDENTPMFFEVFC